MDNCEKCAAMASQKYIVSTQLKVILADLYIETSWREMSILKFQVRERKILRNSGHN